VVTTAPTKPGAAVWTVADPRQSINWRSPYFLPWGYYGLSNFVALYEWV